MNYTGEIRHTHVVGCAAISFCYTSVLPSYVTVTKQISQGKAPGEIKQGFETRGKRK